MYRPISLILVALCVFILPNRRAECAESPLSYSTFAFLSGDWTDGGSESISAVAFLGEGALRFDVAGVSSSGAQFGEVWIAGFDPRGIFYLDVYSPGGWRTAMEGRMIVPARVWAFESAPDPSGNVERRVFTRLGQDEFALKNEVVGPAGEAITAVEKRFLRKSTELVPTPEGA